jgi:poly-D-alanine transfer protein DltD
MNNIVKASPDNSIRKNNLGVNNFMLADLIKSKSKRLLNYEESRAYVISERKRTYEALQSL